MRVISGKCKGKSLKAVPGQATRPTTDKVKEAIFNIIGPFFQGGLALDLYAGSGGLGIEAISRGVERTIFVDQSHKAIEVIHENLKACCFEANAEVYRNEAKRALKAVVKREIAFDLIFLDPPYAKQRLTEEIAFINEHGLLQKKGIIITEHDAAIVLPVAIGGLMQVRNEKYGDTGISIFASEEMVKQQP